MADAARSAVRAPEAAPGVRTFLESERQRILSSCTACGKCYEVCPMTEYIDKKGETTARAISAGVLGLLRNGAADASALHWISVCTRSGACVPACPENVNPKMMIRLARIIALGGLGGEKMITLKEDRDYFPRIRAFAQLQLSDDEIKQWME